MCEWKPARESGEVDRKAAAEQGSEMLWQWHRGGVFDSLGGESL